MTNYFVNVPTETCNKKLRVVIVNIVINTVIIENIVETVIILLTYTDCKTRI